MDRHIKSTSPDTPDACHYVDGRGSELDRVLGLELGADDYLPNRLMIVSWWHVFARSCAVRMERATAKQRQRFTDTGS